MASGSCIKWAGTPKVVSQNYERHGQLSFRMGSRREVSGRSYVGVILLYLNEMSPELEVSKVGFPLLVRQ